MATYDGTICHSHKGVTTGLERRSEIHSKAVLENWVWMGLLRMLILATDPGLFVSFKCRTTQQKGIIFNLCKSYLRKCGLKYTKAKWRHFQIKNIGINHRKHTCAKTAERNASGRRQMTPSGDSGLQEGDAGPGVEKYISVYSFWFFCFCNLCVSHTTIMWRQSCVCEWYTWAYDVCWWFCEEQHFYSPHEETHVKNLYSDQYIYKWKGEEGTVIKLRCQLEKLYTKEYLIQTKVV